MVDTLAMYAIVAMAVGEHDRGRDQKYMKSF